MICGNFKADESFFIYRSSSRLTEFFHDCDTEYTHDGSTRSYWVADTLREILAEPQPSTNTPPEAFSRVIRTLMDQGDALNERSERAGALAQLNGALAREGFEAFYGPDKQCYLRNVGTNMVAAASQNPRRYYSSRNKPQSLTLDELYRKLQHLYLLFRNRDYFKGKAGITKSDLPDAIEHEAELALSFKLFPITQWSEADITEDHVFDAVEFLFDHVSRPGEVVGMMSDSGFHYYDHDGYDDDAGRAEFREKTNAFLADYKSGYELTEQGLVLALGTGGLQHILSAEIIPYDEANVDSKVRSAIAKWRNRRLDSSEKREAIRELADVFEWLKKTKGLTSVLDSKDESALFDIANNFAIRHHNPKQKTNYDRAIWYSWVFHFYLATYHAAVRLLIKHEKKQRAPT
jgi:hypothetical protein